MAHSGKTMTFATDLFPNEDNIYYVRATVLSEVKVAYIKRNFNDH